MEGLVSQRQQQQRQPEKRSEPEKDVVDLFPDKGSQAQKLSVNPMQDCLEEISLAGIFAVEELQ